MLTDKERKAVLLNDRDVMFNRARAELDLENVGRHAKPNTVIVGAPQYPTLPETSWSNQSAAVPPEESFGVDINAVEDLGGGAHAGATPAGSTSASAGASLLSPHEDLAPPNDPSLSHSDGGQANAPPASRATAPAALASPKTKRGLR